jgi:hypothetical protein
MGIKPHGFGVDRNLTAIVGQVWQIAAMHSDGHGFSHSLALFFLGTA